MSYYEKFDTMNYLEEYVFHIFPYFMRDHYAYLFLPLSLTEKNVPTLLERLSVSAIKEFSLLLETEHCQGAWGLDIHEFVSQYWVLSRL